jgi:anti-sigma B factor antagonist
MTAAATATLAITVDPSTRRFVIRVAGEIDTATVNTLASAIHAIDPGDCASVIVDLQDVSFIDSSGLRALLVSRQDLHERGIRLQVRNARPQARQLFSICLGEDLFELEESSGATLRPVTAPQVEHRFTT